MSERVFRSPGARSWTNILCLRPRNGLPMRPLSLVFGACKVALECSPPPRTIIWRAGTHHIGRAVGIIRARPPIPATHPPLDHLAARRGVLAPPQQAEEFVFKGDYP